MDNQQSLVFSAVSGNSLTVRKSGADWIAYFQNTPNLVFLAPQIGMFSYLKLLYISKKTPFDRNLCDMNYFAGDNFGVGNKIACFGGPIETRCEVISIFERCLTDCIVSTAQLSSMTVVCLWIYFVLFLEICYCV